MRQKLLTDGISIALVRAIGMGLGLLVTVVIGRTLGTAGLGIYGYCVILLSLLAVPVSNGWATLVLRSVSRAMHDQEWSTVMGLMRRGAQLSLSLSVLVLLIGLLLYAYFPSISERLPSNAALALLAIVLFFDQLSALRLAVLRGLNHPVWGQIPEMLLRPCLIVAIFLLCSKFLGPAVGVQHAFWSLLGASGITAVMGGLILRRNYPVDISKVPARYDLEAWCVSASLLAGNAGLVIMNSQIDILMLGLLGTFEQVGVYRVAAQIALVSGFVYTAFNMLAMQRFAFLHASSDLHQLATAATLMARVAFIGALPLPIIFYFFGEEILVAVFGDEFSSALQPMFLLFLTQMVSAFVGMGRTLLVMSGKERVLVKLNIVTVALNFVLCYFLIPEFGIMGAAISAAFSICTWNFSTWFLAWRLTGVDSSVIGWFRKGDIDG